MSEQAEKKAKPAVNEIFHELRCGRGHEFVDASNIDELLQMADNSGDAVLAEELREFKSDNC